MRRSAKQPKQWELQVDWGLCAGHGVCSAALGEEIDLDQWGYPRGHGDRRITVPEDLVGAARLAVATCPAVALRLRRVTVE